MKRRFQRQILLLAVACFAFILALAPGVRAYDGYNNPIRVHLSSVSGSVSAQITQGNYAVLNNSGQQVSSVQAGQSVSLAVGQTLSSQDGQGRFKYNSKEYRGDLSNTGAGSKTYQVNRLGMEEYLYSVVALEIGGYAPAIEALKAQAVAARSLACFAKKSPRTPYYDVVSTTSDQAYGGFSSEGYSTSSASVSYRIREACKATENLVMYYNGSLIKGIYCANTGGHSAAAATVWGGDYPYLQGRSVPYDSQSFVADNYSDSSQSSYQAVKTPTSYQWRKTYSYSDVVSKIQTATNQEIGVLQDIVIEHADGGYAKAVTFVGSAGSVTLSGEKVRSSLSLRSGTFSVVLGESLGALQPFSLQYLDSDNFGRFLNRSGKVVNFQGRGYGHSVGMSQWAACVMAHQGITYQEILNYFYSGNSNALTIERFKG